jgi:hypothetical protein
MLFPALMRGSYKATGSLSTIPSAGCFTVVIIIGTHYSTLSWKAGCDTVVADATKSCKQSNIPHLSGRRNLCYSKLVPCSKIKADHQLTLVSFPCTFSQIQYFRGRQIRGRRQQLLTPQPTDFPLITSAELEEPCQPEAGETVIPAQRVQLLQPPKNNTTSTRP